LRELPPIEDPNVLVGLNTGDDAAVYKLTSEIAIVQTVDVFTPVVDDPYEFGKVAAANSLSDVYAMGGRPIMALSIIGFPIRTLPTSQMTAILRGGIDKAKEAGIYIVGGHSIDDPQPKYGLCVTGLVHPDRIYRNSSVCCGDLLILTKPIGSGILTAAIKKQSLSREGVRELVTVMASLNRASAEAMVEVGASAATDVTGFGLLGHLVEMLGSSGLAAKIRLSEVPVMQSARELVRRGICPGGTKRNLDYYAPNIQWHSRIEEHDRLLLADAQTSGGLLISVPASRAAALVHALAQRGVATRAVIGEIIAGPPGSIHVLPG